MTMMTVVTLKRSRYHVQDYTFEFMLIVEEKAD